MKKKVTKKTSLKTLSTEELFARIRACGEAQAIMDGVCGVLGPYYGGGGEHFDDADAKNLFALHRTAGLLFDTLYDKYVRAMEEAERRAGLVAWGKSTVETPLPSRPLGRAVKAKGK